MADKEVIESAKEHFGSLLEAQLKRIDGLKNNQDWIDYSSAKPIIVGILGGDGIGPTITKEAQIVLEHLLKKPHSLV